MFLGAPGSPSRFKKVVYLFVSTILGVLLGLIGYALIEIGYFLWAQRHGCIKSFYEASAFLLLLRLALFVIGAVGGFLLGRFWWRKLYIERVWRKDSCRNKS